MSLSARVCLLGSVVALTALAAGPEAPPASMPPLSLLVQLPVTDLDRSIRFYTGALGCRVSERRDDLQFVHLDCGIDRLQLGLSTGGEPAPVPGSITLNFGVADAGEARRALEARGIAFTGPTRVIPGKVQLAEFLDPDGYRLRLAGPDPATP